MKTAEEWANEMNHGCARQRPDHIALSEIKQIQLDGIKEGMRRAAVIAEGETFASGGIRTGWETAYEQGCNDCEKAILTAAEQLTEKDL